MRGPEGEGAMSVLAQVTTQNRYRFDQACRVKAIKTAALLAFISFLLSLAIEEVPLRTSIAPQPIGDAFEAPRDATSLEELERIVTRMTAHLRRAISSASSPASNPRAKRRAIS